MTIETAIIQGDAWGVGMTLTDDSGNPIDVSAATISGSVHDQSGSLVQTLVFTLGVGTGAFSAAVPDTSAWPIGRLIAEIKIIISGVVAIGQPIRISVVRGYTS